MDIFISGGLGFVGTMLSSALLDKGHRVVAGTLSSEGITVPAGLEVIAADLSRTGQWQEVAGSCDVIINLAGASIFQRWTNKSKLAIFRSRIETTKNIVSAIKLNRGKKISLLSASAMGYYGFHEDELLTEGEPAGTDFLARVANHWEERALEAEEYGARVVLCRFGVVMGAAGALARMIPLYRFWLGSRLGNGRQWFSWIHWKDLVQIFQFLIDHDDITGPVNCTAPEPVRNRDLHHILKEILNKPSLVPVVPGFIIRTILGEFGTVLLKGQRVVPERLTRAGYRFSFPGLEDALNNIIVSD